LREERIVIALNMGAQPISVSFTDQRLSGRVILSSFADREGEEVRTDLALRGNEGLLVMVDSLEVR